jgi:hypothetical protein
MLRILLCAAVGFSAAAAGAQVSAERGFNPRAIELFERDWALMHWAVKRHDTDGDRIISVAETNAAARVFREIADSDRDGRVTPWEYDRAREFVIARY